MTIILNIVKYGNLIVVCSEIRSSSDPKYIIFSDNHVWHGIGMSLGEETTRKDQS